MDLSCKLFIGNLPKDVTEGELLRLFTEYGELQEIFIMGGERSRSGQSSAFVKYASVEACERAIAGVNMRGRVRADDPDPVVVKYAKSTTGKRERPESSVASTGVSSVMPSPSTESSVDESFSVALREEGFLAPSKAIADPVLVSEVIEGERTGR